MAENKIEKIKRAKDGLAVWPDIERYAREGYHSIEGEDLERFKWYGIYTQRPPEDGFFMMRIKVPNGALTSEQLMKVGSISVRYARGSGDITTRQNIQLHWLRIEDIPTVVAELKEVGLTTTGACGDTVRNVVGCPLAGVDGEELIDALPIVKEVTARFLGNPDFSNLPRKYKISISGCRAGCGLPEIHDIGLAAMVKEDGEKGELGFDLSVGGGLGPNPHMGVRLNAFVRPEEVVEVCHHITAIFRDCGYREKRHHARLKFLVADWGGERFRSELEARLGRSLTDAGQGWKSPDPHRDHIGVHRQKGDGLYYVGAATLAGRISGEQMMGVAGLAIRLARGRLRNTNMQNIVILDVPEGNLNNLCLELEGLGLPCGASVFRRGTISCTGIQFCKLAFAETKERGAEIVAHLEAAFPELEQKIRTNVNGCPNACAHYQIADIGLLGSLIKEGGEQYEGFQIYLGGHLGEGAQFGRHLRRRVRAEEAKYYIEKVVRSYLSHRSDGESFQSFIGRLSDKELEGLA